MERVAVWMVGSLMVLLVLMWLSLIVISFYRALSNIVRWILGNTIVNYPIAIPIDPDAVGTLLDKEDVWEGTEITLQELKDSLKGNDNYSGVVIFSSEGGFIGEASIPEVGGVVPLAELTWDDLENSR